MCKKNRFWMALTGFIACTGVAQAQGIETYVKQVAQTHQNAVAVVSNRPAQVVYVQQHNGCEQVAVLWKGTPQQNFEVCGPTVRDKHSVAPSWPTDGSTRDVLALVVQHALAYGQSQSVDQNGYRVAAQRLNDVGKCAVVQILVSYEGDLSDMAVQKVCK